MRPHGTPQQLERRRRRAIALLKKGNNLSATARLVDASVSSVFRWWQAYQGNGQSGLKPRPTPGRPPRLSERQKTRLAALLLKGPLAAGYTTDLWTLRRVGRLIEKHFRVHYHPCHAWKILRGMGWSCQKPERRALQRDEKAIEHWKRYTWPRIKKSRSGWRPPRVPR